VPAAAAVQTRLTRISLTINCADEKKGGGESDVIGWNAYLRALQRDCIQAIALWRWIASQLPLTIGLVPVFYYSRNILHPGPGSSTPLLI